MKRHRFEPAALVMGLVLVTLAVLFVLDACGVWHMGPDAATAAAGAGLGLAAVSAVLTQVARFVRARRERRHP